MSTTMGDRVVDRIWDRFLTEQDRALLTARPRTRWGFGTRPALLLVDLYRGVFGDRPEPLLEAIRTWPDSCGLAGWEALPQIQRLLQAARDARVPVVHLTGSVAVPGWSTAGPQSDGQRERRRRSYEILPEVAPLDAEPVIVKAAPSGFAGTPLLGYLIKQGIDTLLVAGEATSGCVRATVVDGRTYRYRVVVVEECVFDRTEAAHAMNLFDMDQKYADVVGLTEVTGHLSTLGRGRVKPGRESAWE